MNSGRALIWFLLVVVLASSASLLHPQDTAVMDREIELTVSEGTAVRPIVSPDRRWIAFDLLGALWIVPFEGGEARRITPDSLEHVHASDCNSQLVAIEASHFI